MLKHTLKSPKAILPRSYITLYYHDVVEIKIWDLYFAGKLLFILSCNFKMNRKSQLWMKITLFIWFTLFVRGSGTLSGCSIDINKWRLVIEFMYFFKYSMQLNRLFISNVRLSWYPTPACLCLNFIPILERG